MNKFVISVIIIGILACLVIFFPRVHKTEVKNDNTTVNTNHSKLSLDIADTDEERELGLGGRESMSESSGMLFVFETPDKYAFWMKDMRFPLDIIWMDENYQIVYIEKGLTPETFPQMYEPDTNSLYVLEVNAGFAEKNNLKIGDKLDLK